jgi:predicted CoA-binding protein
VPLVDDIAGLRRILRDSRTIAVVGLSAHWYRPSYFAAKYMQDHGYRIIPVNPNYGEVLGEKCYPALAAIPVPVDIVDCFRRADEMVPIAHDAVAIALGPVDAARDPQRGGGENRSGRRAFRSHGPLRQDRARANPGRPQLGGREHRCHLRPPAGMNAE